MMLRKLRCEGLEPRRLLSADCSLFGLGGTPLDAPDPAHRLEELSTDAMAATIEVVAGDANDDGQFDHLDIVQVLQAGKYLTGEPATFAQGDWTGDGVFDQFDIVAALQADGYSQSFYSAVTMNVKIPASELADIPCTEDSVVLEGTIHSLVIQNVDDSGGLHLTWHSNYQGLSGISEKGVQYHGVGVDRQTLNFPSSGAQEATAVENFSLIGAGAENDVQAQATIHITVNANGEVTADVMEITATCGVGG